MLSKSWLLTVSVVLAVSGVATALPTKNAAPTNINTFPDCTLVAGNLIANCRFDTGTFMGWTQGGDLSASSVQGGCGHSGPNCAFMGPVFYNGTLTQGLATGAASTCSVSFWLANSGTPSHFGVEWNGQPVMDLYYVPGSLNYTQFSVSNLPTTGSAFVTFEFYNPPSFISFTDVVVTCP